MVDKKQAVEPASAVEQQEKLDPSINIDGRAVSKAKKSKSTKPKRTYKKKVSELSPEELAKIRQANKEHSRKFRASIRGEYSDLRMPMKREVKDKLLYLSKTYEMTVQDIIHKLVEAEYDRLAED